MSLSKGATAASLANSISIDAVVANLDKPESLSTLAKTNIDWEQYKVKEGKFSYDRVDLLTFAGWRVIASCGCGPADDSLASLSILTCLSSTSTTPFPNSFLSSFLPHAGLDEQFENRAAKGGFVERQAFLSRVDERQAEADRAARAQERRARDLASMAGGGVRGGY
jgi:hypothetical protein